MGSYWLNVAVLRVIIPVTFAACTIWRPTGLSLIYLGLMLYSPMVPIATAETMKGHTGNYLKACVTLSFLTSLTQLMFHIVLLSLPPYGYFLEACTFLEMIFRHLGLVRLDGATVWEIVFWLLPEIIAFPTTIAMYLLCKRTTWEPHKEDDESSTVQPAKKIHDDANAKVTNFLGTIGTYVVLGSLCCVSSLTPSVEGAFYFIIFIGASSWWACHRELRKGFAFVCRFVMAVVVVHILVLMTYQNQWSQEFVPVNSTWARYFALDPYYTSNCSDPRYIDYVDSSSEWTSYSHALGLFWLYYVLALQSRFLFRKPPKQHARLSGKLTNLDTSLSRHVSIRRRTPSQRWQSAKRKARLMRFGSGRTGLLQDSTGSVIVQDAHNDDSIQLQSLSEGESDWVSPHRAPDEGPGIVEQVIMAVYSIFQLIVNSSYLATNIIMMTWSIMYHSWTTFILLMWALVLWMVPNKRSSMMKCSPFIVFYATLLLLVGYIYSMNLTEEELPTVFHDIKVAEIGFRKPFGSDPAPSWHQIVKCAFTTMFWITMRQYMAERQSQKRSSAMRDMVAPLHVSVSTATTAMNKETPEIKSQFMKDVGRVVKKLLIKFWIAIVAIMLFTSGITGERMTVFRIIYMSLFLVFVITFQFSWTAWRKMMYGFWITVIAYSVAMLILVYTYQFSNFPGYWTRLGIDEALQMDIGLESYKTKELFVRLLTPTFFVIVTVLQIHYFHEDFLEITNIERTGVDLVSRRGSLGYSSTVPIVSTSSEEAIPADGEKKTVIYTLKQLKHMSKMERMALMRKTIENVKNFYDWIWLILEIHMQKIIFISFILLCIKDVCAINLFFVIAVVVAINFQRSVQITSINAMAGIIAILMVAKMLYQIEYIVHENWDVNCSRTDANGTESVTTYNVAKWIGMDKARTGELPYLLRGYIGMVTVTTIRAIIVIRQCFHRHEKGEPLETPLVMFPKITRADADKGIPECLKFLFNYGFYKFGLEFCLMGIVALIGTRLDFYSVLYGIWLLVLFSMKRTTTARVWPFFRIFAIVVLPLQYAFVVAPPTWLCINYPWSILDDSGLDTLRRLQDWMYFPDPEYPPSPEKLICDFILLMMIVRQSLVFRIEARSRATGEEFIAGHNFSVSQEMEKPNFVNPVKDYVSLAQCWLDVFKRGSMMSFMWITLSIMFLAGTNRTNIFSLGYLIGAFIFLWQGSDFYLRPIKTILKWWNFLIGYNVVVIFSKAILQGVGCVLLKQMETSVCWLVQLLGIACLKKFHTSGTIFDGKDNYCEVPREDIGMVWDGLCFACLLVQKRLFKSYYFFHIVDETKAMSILASRGAELLQDLHRKRIEYQENVEKAVLQKLKFKMDKIKADQQRIQGPSYREPATHKIDTLYPRDRPLYKHRVPKTNREAVRSGDYYMFDDLDDDDVTDHLVPDLDDKREEDERLRQQQAKGRRMTVAELMTTVLKTDIEIATHVAMYGGTQKDALRLRRQSVPLTRKKSSMSYLSARSETDTAAATDIRDAASLDSAEVEDVEQELKTEDLAKTPADSVQGDELTEDPTRASGVDKDRGKDQDEEDDEEPEGDPDKQKSVSLLTYLKFVLVILNSTMVSMTKYLNRFSRDYRYIRKVLTKEKRILKAKPDFRMGTRLGINQIWQPIPVMKQRSDSEESTDESSGNGQRPGPSSKSTRRKESSLTVPHIRILAPSLERGLDVSSSSSIFGQAQAEPEPEDEGDTLEELSEDDQPPIVQLAASIWFGILAHSTFMCYFMVFLHHVKNASVISIPLPLMVFCWGSLTIPRPSKTFWVTLIAYTEVIVIVKCIFQFEIILWNQMASPNHPLFPPRILGIEKKPNYALWDLWLLLMIFFHRFMLKSLGQWTAPVKPRKIIPTNLTMRTRNEDGQGGGEPARFHWQNEETNNTTETEGTSTKRESSNEGEEIEAPKNEEITDSNERLVVVKTTETSPCDKDLKTAVNMIALKYWEPMKIFFDNILSPEGKEKTNVYAYMFLCDFFNFILLIFGFSAFGTQQGDGGVTAYLAENRVPMPFLLMLLLQFALIVIDRALFLRKSIMGKLVFQYLLVFGVHICMFFILPSVTERRFNEKLPPQIWYMVKCFYLLLAAYQLRLGYPTRILGNFLCKNYSIINMYLFKGFMVVPFLFELRAVMDWIWTDTSMTIMDWFKMEDIFASIYQIRCTRGVETDFPQPRGVKKTQVSKYMVGGGALFLMIALIWFPLLLFALGGTVGDSNPPTEVSMKIRIGPYEPIYAMSAQTSSIVQYSEADFRSFKDIYARDKAAVTFLENYVNTDVTAITLSGSSRKLWAISPPDRERLRMELESNSTVIVHVEWTVARKTDVKDFNGVSTEERDIPLKAWENGQFNPVRKSLADLLLASTDSNSPNGTIVMRNAFPKFLKVTSRTVEPVRQLMNLYGPDRLDDSDTDHLYRNISLHLSTNADCCAHQQWWVVKENCDDVYEKKLLSKVPLNDCRYIMMFLFNDKAFPEGLSFISGFGILGLYTTGVIVMSQLIRRSVSEMAPKIMFDDLPYVDRILRLCLDIYLVRESGELSLEEDLFAKLIFLYRSPETLIRWTRPPEPGSSGNPEEDEDDDEDVVVRQGEQRNA
ncbi:piezo-type mechanosensitive ion channel component isoform X3 [Venturia canescens]|uniref:piezo-type mechanosensitive ion channel component isoform X3 n=1 Tax=Venturia canescens TaxID=32260 RepID=UPI001C9CD109|nr:piezo-type mechanosensitive ion channel component isoform X3 [Venturia canescens]